MNFDLTAEQEAFRGVVREFAEEVVAPQAAESDQQERFPLDVVKQMGALGFFGMPFPEQYGGSGADAITVCLAIEELGRADQSVGGLQSSPGVDMKLREKPEPCHCHPHRAGVTA